MLNDKNIKPFSDRFNERLTFLWNMVSMFKQIQHQHSSKIGLTLDTTDVLHLTLNSISYLIPELVTKMKYVLTAKLQSDRIQMKFGIYR